jgi:hypothetical protein
MPLIETIGSGSAKAFGLNSFKELTISGHPTSGLVLDWDFADPASYSGSGKTVIDRSGNGRTGTATTQTNFSSDIYGGGFVFTGRNPDVTWIDFPSNTFITSGNNSFTLEAWYDWYGVPGASALLVNYPGSDGSSTAWLYYGGIYLQNANGYIDNPDTRCVGRNHIVATRSGGVLKTYFNGVLEKTNTNTTSIPNSQWRVGSDYSSGGAGGETFGGKIYITRAYNRALSDAEVLSTYNTYKGRFGK